MLRLLQGWGRRRGACEFGRAAEPSVRWGAPPRPATTVPRPKAQHTAPQCVRRQAVWQQQRKPESRTWGAQPRISPASAAVGKRAWRACTLGSSSTAPVHGLHATRCCVRGAPQKQPHATYLRQAYADTARRCGQRTPCVRREAAARRQAPTLPLGCHAPRPGLCLAQVYRPPWQATWHGRRRAWYSRTIIWRLLDCSMTTHDDDDDGVFFSISSKQAIIYTAVRGTGCILTGTRPSTARSCGAAAAASWARQR